MNATETPSLDPRTRELGAELVWAAGPAALSALILGAMRAGLLPRRLTVAPMDDELKLISLHEVHGAEGTTRLLLDVQLVSRRWQTLRFDARLEIAARVQWGAGSVELTDLRLEAGAAAITTAWGLEVAHDHLHEHVEHTLAEAFARPMSLRWPAFSQGTAWARGGHATVAGASRIQPAIGAAPMHDGLVLGIGTTAVRRFMASLKVLDGTEITRCSTRARGGQIGLQLALADGQTERLTLRLAHTERGGPLVVVGDGPLSDAVRRATDAWLQTLGWDAASGHFRVELHRVPRGEVDEVVELVAVPQVLHTDDDGAWWCCRCSTGRRRVPPHT